MNQASRVVVVDDSAMMRNTVSDALRTIRGVEIVGVAASGPEALDVIEALKPDIVSLDIELPGLDGLAVLSQTMKRQPTRVVLVSAHTTAGAETTIEGLSLGALDFVPKPSVDEGLDTFKVRLRRTFRAALLAKVPFGEPEQAPAAEPVGTLRPAGLAVVASSTGGPRALYDFFASLDTPPSVPLAVVQHMPPKFTATLATRLDGAGPTTVVEASDGESIEPGKAVIAPGSAHMEIGAGTVRLTDDPPIGGLRPRADVAMSSAVAHYGGHIVGVVMTGMGSDGLLGCRDIKRAGGQVIAQDGPSSTVDGMPQAIRNAGIADMTGPPATMAKMIAATPYRLVSHRGTVPVTAGGK
jgi:two-component system chemotaxis response regulator CheB